MIDIMDINRWIRIEQIDELHNEIDGYEWIETDGYEWLDGDSSSCNNSSSRSRCVDEDASRLID